MWWNLGFQATAPVILIGLLRLKEGLTEKKTPRERLQKGNRVESLRMLRNRSWRSSIPLRNALRQRRYGSLEWDLSLFLRSNFVRFAGPLNIFVFLLVPVDKKLIGPNLRLTIFKNIWLLEYLRKKVWWPLNFHRGLSRKLTLLELPRFPEDGGLIREWG